METLIKTNDLVALSSQIRAWAATLAPQFADARPALAAPG